jgi:hypothetical protein
MLITLSRRYHEVGDLAGERAALERAAQIDAQLREASRTD